MSSRLPFHIKVLTFLIAEGDTFANTCTNTTEILYNLPLKTIGKFGSNSRKKFIKLLGRAIYTPTYIKIFDYIRSNLFFPSRPRDLKQILNLSSVECKDILHALHNLISNPAIVSVSSGEQYRPWKDLGVRKNAWKQYYKNRLKYDNVVAESYVKALLIHVFEEGCEASFSISTSPFPSPTQLSKKLLSTSPEYIFSLSPERLVGLWKDLWTGSQRDFQRMYGIHQSTLTRWLSGKRTSQKACQAVKFWLIDSLYSEHYSKRVPDGIYLSKEFCERNNVSLLHSPKGDGECGDVRSWAIKRARFFGEL